MDDDLADRNISPTEFFGRNMTTVTDQLSHHFMQMKLVATYEDNNRSLWE